ncbi:MAG TPA: MarC family protein [Ignavibacteria bacterium]|nr:MarC family protein [Ignavibacteria bacterium]
MSEVTYYIKVFIAIIVLVNPVEGIPLFLSRTSSLTREQKFAIAKKTSIAVFTILIISLYLGRYLLELFGIGIPAFTLAGGVIIFLVALDMVLGKSNLGDKNIPDDPSENPENIAVVPLAIPLLAGPGAISSVILYGSKSDGFAGDIILTGIVLLVAVSVAISLRAATRMQKVLSQTGIDVLTKVTGLLVAAIAVQLIFSGLEQMIPSLMK